MLPNKTIPEAASYLRDLAAEVGLPEPIGNKSFAAEANGFSGFFLGLTLDTPADFDVIVAWNANGADSPHLRQDHSIIVAPVWDWETGYTLEEDDAKRIAETFAECYPSNYGVAGTLVSGEDVQRVVSSGRPAYYIPVQAGNGSVESCTSEGACTHGCRPPSRWVTVDARSGFIWGVSDWSPCY